MTRQLVQKRLFRKMVFEIAENELRIVKSVAGQFTQWSVPFEELGSRTLIKRGSLIPIYASGAFGLLIVGALTYEIFTGASEVRNMIFPALIFSAFPLLLILGRDQSLFLIGGQKTIEFYLDTPNEQTVHDFVNDLIATSNAFLKKKYSSLDPDLPLEPQIGRLLWLRDRDILTEGEFQSAKEGYLRSTNARSNGVGFTT